MSRHKSSDSFAYRFLLLFLFCFPLDNHYYYLPSTAYESAKQTANIRDSNNLEAQHINTTSEWVEEWKLAKYN